MTGIRLEFLKSTGQGHGMLQMQKYNQILQEIQQVSNVLKLLEDSNLNRSVAEGILLLMDQPRLSSAERKCS